MLTPNSTVKLGKKFGSWTQFFAWDRVDFLEALRLNKPDPLTLPVELSTEAVLADWTLEPFGQSDKPYRSAALFSEHITYQLRVDRHADALIDRLTKAAKANKRPALFGSVHVESGHPVFMPLSLLGPKGPDYCTLHLAKVDKATLIRALNIA